MALQSTVALANIVLSANAPSITFSNIPQNYKDLILVADWASVSDTGTGVLRFNNDSSSIYNIVALYGAGTGGPSAFSQSNQPQDIGIFPRVSRSGIIMKMFEYSSTTKHKNYTCRQSAADYAVWIHAGKYSSLSPISSITITPTANFVAGTVLSLYGRIA